MRERNRVAEDDCRRLVEALAVAEATVATSVAEVQVRADHLMVRARCEADHLTMRAREEAERIREEIELERVTHEADSWLASEQLRPGPGQPGPRAGPGLLPLHVRGDRGRAVDGSGCSATRLTPAGRRS